jgi:hypothetical protein
MSLETAQIEICEPKRFSLGAILIVHAWNILLVIPVIASLLVVSLMKLSAFTALIPLAAVALTAIYLPLGQGNAYLARLVSSWGAEAPSGKPAFIVQLTLFPRLRSGFRALVEDADDIGLLSFTDSGLMFQGDSISLILPFAQIRELSPQNVGLRGLFIAGRRIELSVSGLDRIEFIEIAERSAWSLFTSRRMTAEMFRLCSTSMRERV